jgi:membrane protease YdiL (CAAX protease family)
MTPAGMDPTTLQSWKELLFAPEAWLLTFGFVVVLPALGYVRFRRLAAPAGSSMPAGAKVAFYGRVMVSQWLLAAAMLVVATLHGLTPAAVGEQLADARLTAGVTLGLVAVIAVGAAVVSWRVRRACPESLAKSLGRMGRFAPAFGAEMAGFALLSATAGICEELLYRGWLVNLLRAATGSVWLAVAVGAAVFGLAHAYQGIAGVLRAAFVGLQLALLFVFVGSLVPGQVLHAAVDLLVGYASALRMARARSQDPR